MNDVYVAWDTLGKMINTDPAAYAAICSWHESWARKYPPREFAAPGNENQKSLAQQQASSWDDVVQKAELAHSNAQSRNKKKSHGGESARSLQDECSDADSPAAEGSKSQARQGKQQGGKKPEEVWMSQRASLPLGKDPARILNDAIRFKCKDGSITRKALEDEIVSEPPPRWTYSSFRLAVSQQSLCRLSPRGHEDFGGGREHG
jgi:hypothetical protein